MATKTVDLGNLVFGKESKYEMEAKYVYSNIVSEITPAEMIELHIKKIDTKLNESIIAIIPDKNILKPNQDKLDRVMFTINKHSIKLNKKDSTNISDWLNVVLFKAKRRYFRYSTIYKNEKEVHFVKNSPKFFRRGIGFGKN